ncbi:nucleoside triphosphatase ytkD [Planococcus antarcticus DSM 14505]|uniref:Nucleoside triphosphatase YtkD n=1 Tax=Planococcus antarcticus DSM 14505 TaxID=1185653 RepID=A0A1C7DJ61_9BACL|nr:nucleoside triphosphatase YtkD [Planococcus antarcticus]ANU11495.1 nucleoside triphosphatase YtkD [Planococcus antarcticus DSM 14505]EIM05397.1 nucleoside triphosphatase ytkD [Planococcus antarcticus DSM 14505]
MQYRDLNGYPCELSFEKNNFSYESRHVLVICRYNGKWVLTRHNERGLEFPGGKVETGESLQAAAKREVYEETGACVNSLEWFAEYMVYSTKPFCKTVFVGAVEKVNKIPLLETQGIILVEELEPGGEFSFLMKDAGMRTIIEKVKQLEKWDD